MTLILTHPIVALVLISLFVALVTLVVGGIMAKQMPKQSDIEPGDFADDNTCANVAVELAGLGFDVKAWGADFQITDSTGVTFYMPKAATLEQCLERYAQKLEQFKAA
jgi:hypothetical protein